MVLSEALIGHRQVTTTRTEVNDGTVFAVAQTNSCEEQRLRRDCLKCIFTVQNETTIKKHFLDRNLYPAGGA